MIDKKTVEHVAHLARIAISPEENERIGKQLADILGYINKLNELDVSTVEPMRSVVSENNVLREDCVKPRGDPKLLLHNAPGQEEGYFKIPRVIE